MTDYNVSIYTILKPVTLSLTRDRVEASLSLTGGMCPWARHFIFCLVLVQTWKTHPDMTEKLLTGA